MKFFLKSRPVFVQRLIDLPAPPFVKPAMAASALALSLFWLLYFFISGGGDRLQKLDTVPTIDFLRLAKNFELETRERKPPKAPEKPKAPPEVVTPQAQIEAPTGADQHIVMDVNGPDLKAGFGLGEGEYLPIVKVNPIYPPGAQSRGQSGWVLLEFTVTETGSVVDPVVVEAQPPGVFDDAAKRAVVKFKYKPRVVDGKPVRVPHVQHLITFKIEK